MDFQTSDSTSDFFLKQGGRYCFSVAAIDAISLTNFLNDRTAIESDRSCAYAAQVPDAPGGVYFTREIRNRILVRWPPPLNIRGSAVDFYQLAMQNYRRRGWAEQPWEIVATRAPENATFWVENCRHAYDMFYFKVRAKNAVGWSDYSGINLGECALKPDTPKKPVRLRGTRTSITVLITAPDDNGAQIISYKLYWAQTDGDFNDFEIKYFSDPHRYYSKTLNYTVEALSPGTKYRFKVAAVNSAGQSPFSPTMSTICVGSPGPVTNIKFSYSNIGGTSISWSPPEDDGGMAVEHYKVGVCSYKHCGYSVVLVHRRTVDTNIGETLWTHFHLVLSLMY